MDKQALPRGSTLIYCAVGVYMYMYMIRNVPEQNITKLKGRHTMYVHHRF